MTAKKCIICGKVFGIEEGLMQRKKSYCMDCREAWAIIKKQKISSKVKFQSRLGLTKYKKYNWQTSKKYILNFNYIPIKACDDSLVYGRGV